MNNCEATKMTAPHPSIHAKILAAAVEQFAADGFEGANMDAIARRAGVAKPTIYNHFKDKSALYLASIEYMLGRNRATIASPSFASLPAGKGILKVALELTWLFGRDDDMLMFCKMCIAGNERFQTAADVFLRNGPWRGTDEIASLLRVWHERGELRIDRPSFAARQLSELCKTDIFDARLFGGPAMATEEECRFTASEAARTFLARYARHERRML
ncbi:TetR/AcrR family transcriptional regulator [Erythrobacter westpacificensis]|uniref:TetR/AcrR family transcriptional regulator n=3 Tax=Erythrobacteraceae TaxID=335929 RepID=A0A418NTQ2_9SPHN|nr:TetR/AcrR family transcriptional regulator [Aurantiacibacter zhengii]